MSTPKELDKLRKQLIDCLDKPSINYDRVLELARQISLQDDENVRFFVDASHISRLGRELVVKKETAVSELIKNAYDADATQVTLTFENTAQAGGKLTIEDDGHGMDRDQIIAGFMRLSTTTKIHESISPKYHRRRAGRKGIGRFAAQRLANRLTIITQTKSSPTASKITFDWSKFAPDTELFSISNHIEEIPKQKQHGSIFVLEDLEDGWTIEAIKRVHRYILDLIQPFYLSKVYSMDGRDPGFKVNIFQADGNETTEVASEEKILYDYALAEINAKVDENGLGRWSIKSKQLEVSEKNNPIGEIVDGETMPFPFIRNVHLKAFYYIYNSGRENYLTAHDNTTIKRLAKERSGIRVYRNGFRVLPFGEPGDDWLKLDAVTARRGILIPFRNMNFFGFVELFDPEGRLFEETASREGLVDTPAFQELGRFVFLALSGAALRIGEIRERKTKPTTTTRSSPEEKIRKAIENAHSATEELSKVAPIGSQSILSEIQQALTNIGENVSEQSEQTETLLNELAMLRILASMGLVIAEFTHEVKHLYSSITASVKHIGELNSSKKVKDAVKVALQNISTLKTYASYFDKSVSANVRREIAPQELGKTIRDFIKTITPAAERYGISIAEPELTGYNIISKPMHTSEWTSILFNLYTNAYKAIKRAGRNKSDGKILFRAGREKDKIFMEFADNGDGISAENQERIFNAFFTTATPASPDTDENEELLGTGLGLKIIKDIVTAHNGEISLTGAPRGYITCFRIELPAATDKELESYGY